MTAETSDSASDNLQSERDNEQFLDSVSVARENIVWTRCMRFLADATGSGYAHSARAKQRVS